MAAARKGFMRASVLLFVVLVATGCPSPGKRTVVVDPSEVPSLNQTRWTVTHEPRGDGTRETR